MSFILKRTRHDDIPRKDEENLSEPAEAGMIVFRTLENYRPPQHIG